LAIESSLEEKAMPLPKTTDLNRFAGILSGVQGEPCTKPGVNLVRKNLVLIEM